MCLYPRLIRNPKYLPNKKNGGNVPTPSDKRALYVPIGCGNCIECRQQYARQWVVRLNEELKHNRNCIFITLSFSEQSLQALCAIDTNVKDVNAIATKAVRLFLERWREYDGRARKKELHGEERKKIHGRACKHWLVTELGQNETERIHLHGIIWDNKPHSPCYTREKIEQLWKYGNIYIGDYCNERTINYIVKYISKIDEKHKTYKPVILASKGLGEAYTKSNAADLHKYQGELTKDYYTLNTGQRVQNPIYYRNKLYTEDERERLWMQKLNKQTIYVRGIECDVSTKAGQERYIRLLHQQQQENIKLGFGDNSAQWKKRTYKITLAMLNHKVRRDMPIIHKIKKMHSHTKKMRKHLHI